MRVWNPDKHWEVLSKWYVYVGLKIILVGYSVVIMATNPNYSGNVMSEFASNFFLYGGGLAYAGFQEPSTRYNPWFIALHWLLFGLYMLSYFTVSKLRKDITVLTYVELFLSFIGLVMFESDRVTEAL